MEALDSPARPVCVLSAADWSTAYPDLFIGLGTSGSPIFAYVRAGRAKFTVGAEGEASLLEVTTPRVTVRGYPATTEFIHTKRAVLFGGWLVNLPQAPLTLASGAPLVEGTLEVDGPSPPHVRALARHGETAILACDELTLVPEPFDTAAVLPTSPAIRDSYLPERDVPLSLTPDGASVAVLKATAGCEPVQVIEQRGSHVRIVWRDDQGIVFGWIDQAALSPAAPPRPSRAPTTGDAPPSDPGEPPAEIRTCATPVRLLEGGRYGAKSFPVYRVGTIEPQTPIGVVAREETRGYASIKLSDHAGVRFAEDALLLVPTVDLLDCRGD